MNTIRLFLLLSAFLITGRALAIDTPDLTPPKRPYLGPDYTIGFDVWYLSNDGNFSYQGGRNIRIPEDTEFSKGTDTYPLFILVRRIGPFLPDLRLHSYRYVFEGDLKYTDNTRFGGVTFSPGSKTHISVYGFGVQAFYYSNPFGFRGIELKYGLEIRRFGGEIGMSGEDANKRAPTELKYDVTGEVISYLPLAHLGFTYLFANPQVRMTMEGEILQVGDYSFYDMRGIVEYKVLGILMGGGYRHNFFGGRIEIEDSDINIHTKGTFVRFSVAL